VCGGEATPITISQEGRRGERIEGPQKGGKKKPGAFSEKVKESGNLSFVEV